MSSAWKNLTGNKIIIIFETDVEVAGCLKNLVKYHKKPIADVMEALICYELESVIIKEDQPPSNDFDQKPRMVRC